MLYRWIVPVIAALIPFIGMLVLLYRRALVDLFDRVSAFGTRG